MIKTHELDSTSLTENGKIISGAFENIEGVIILAEPYFLQPYFQEKFGAELNYMMNLAIPYLVNVRANVGRFPRIPMDLVPSLTVHMLARP